MNNKLLIEYDNFILNNNSKLHSLLIWTKLDDLQSYYIFNNIKIISTYKINWSSEYYYQNFNRLNRIVKSSKKNNQLNKYNLYLIVFKVEEDNNLLQNIRGELKHTNLKLIDLENILQNDENVINYMISYTEYELNSMLILLLGLENKFYNIFLINSQKEVVINKDLGGYNGWNNLSELFKVLNYSHNWLVLRNYEEHSDNYVFGEGDDIDMLCENIDKFTAIMNAKDRPGGRCSYFVEVNNMKIPLDIRFIGDKYYDPVWEKDMLERKQYKGIIPVLSEYDYFFALLYHIRLQKRFIKPIYVERLDYLKKLINLVDIPDKFIYNEDICKELLNNFLLTNNYHYTYTDNAVRNEEFVKFMKRQEINDLCDNCKVLLKSLFKQCKKEFFRLPSRIKNKIIRILKGRK